VVVEEDDVHGAQVVALLVVLELEELVDHACH